MLSFPATIQVFLCTLPCDVRRSFDGLSMMAEHIVKASPLSGHLFVYCNRRSDRLKILYRDRDGWAIWYKRLEVGTFQYPFSATGRKEIAAWELGVLLGVRGAALVAFRQWLIQQTGLVLPKSPIAVAIGYTLANRTALGRCAAARQLAPAA